MSPHYKTTEFVEKGPWGSIHVLGPDSETMPGQVDWYSIPNLVQFLQSTVKQTLHVLQLCWQLAHTLLHWTRSDNDNTTPCCCDSFAVDWTSVIPARLQWQEPDPSRQFLMKDILLHKRETVMYPATFEENIMTLPEHIQHLLHTFRVEPGDKCVHRKCLQNNRLIKVGT